MIRYLLFILALAAVCGGGYTLYERYEASMPKTLAQSTRPKFDIFLIIDHSGSMKGDSMDPIPSDPEGIRVKAAKYFVDYLQHFSDPASIHRISIINFGSDTPDDKQIPLTPLNSVQKAKEIKDKIQEYSLGYTNFLQAIKKAHEFFQKDQIPGEARQPVIIIFTDGEPKDTRGLSKEAYFKELEDYANTNLKNMKMPGVARQTSYKMYVIGLDARGAYWKRDEAQWNHLTSNGASLLSQANEEELEARYGKIIETLFSTQAGDWQDLKAGEELKFIIPPYVEKALITVKKDLKVQNQKLEILTPKGAPLKEGAKLQASPGAGITLYALVEPEAGEWKLKLTPNGKVRVKNDLLPIRLEITRPQPIHPVGESLDMSVTFLRSDGHPITPLSQYPISLSAAIKKPDGSILRPSLKEDSKRRGYYRSDKPLPAATEGTHEITCEVNVGSFLQTGNFTLSKTSLPVEVKPIVYFKPTSPSGDKPHNLWNILTFWKRSPITVEGKLMRSGKELPASETAAYNRNELVLAQAEREKGQGVTGVDFLKYQEASNSYRAALQPNSNLYPAPHNLFTRCELPSADGTKQVREDNFDFLVRYGYGIIAWVILAYAILYAIGQALLRILRGPLVGQLSVKGRPLSGRLSDILIYNKCKISSKKKKFVLPWINAKQYEGDSNSPTFWVIGSSQRMHGKTMPAIIVYHRKFGVIPWWTKLHKSRTSTVINSVTINWHP